MSNCNECLHSRPYEPVQTCLEDWEEDTRPERPKGLIGALRWFWNPNQFREAHPYSEEWIGSYYETIDAFELANRRDFLMCSFMPVHKKVHRNHYCGQFQHKVT